MVPVSILREFVLAPVTDSYLSVPGDVVTVATGVGVAVYSGSAALLLEGPDADRVVKSIFPLLDGTRTATDLCAAMPEIACSELQELLDALRENGLLIDAPSRALPALLKSERSLRLGDSRVSVVGEPGMARTLAKAMLAAGVGSVAVSWDELSVADLAVGVFGSGMTDAIAEFHGVTGNCGVRTLPCLLHSREALIGPVTVAGKSPCWNCAAMRMAANAGMNAEETHGDVVIVEIDEVITALLAREACAILLHGNGESRLREHVLVLDKATLRTSLHRVAGVPGCMDCGGPPAARLNADDRHALPFVGTTEMLAAQFASWFVDSRTGILNRIVLDDAAAMGIPVPMVVTAVPADAPVASGPQRSIPAGWGKGMVLEDATVSAIGEAIERYSASMPDSRRIVWSRPAELAGEKLDPEAFALYAASQYASRDFPFVPFDPELAHPWVQGQWLVDRAPVWVPAVLAYLAMDIGREHNYCQGTSNGLAAGIDPSEAAIRAVLELLERDAFMSSWRARRPGQRVRLDRTLHPDLRAVVDGISSLAARFELVLLPALGGYPTAVSLAYGDGIAWPGVTLGLATDPDPRVAIRQAILELGQTGPYLRRLMHEGNRPVPATASKVREMIDHARYYFLPDRARALDYLWHTSNTCSLADLPQGSERSLHALGSSLAAAGARVALVDVTSPDIAIHPLWVMRAVSPDLQPISFGYGLERLSVPRLAAIGDANDDNRIAPIW